MPTFLSRRYLRRPQQVGTIEKLLGVSILCLLVILVAVFVQQSLTNKDYLFNVNPKAYQAEAPASVAAENPFPAPGIKGWLAPRNVARYSPDDLYVKIDGRADAYMQFNVVSLVFGSYQHEGDPQRTVDVYWYDMGKPVNAFGIYRAEAPPDAESAGYGQQSYSAGGAVFFWKAGSYVQVLPTGMDAADADAASAIAKRIDEAIESVGEGQWASALLPKTNQVPDSLEYLAADAFGLEFLTDVFAAGYQTDAGEYTLFIHQAESDAAARALLDRYVQYLEQYGRVIWRGPDAARPMVAGDVSGMIDAVFVKGPYFGGVSGADDLDLAREAAEKFREQLPSREQSP